MDFATSKIDRKEVRKSMRRIHGFLTMIAVVVAVAVFAIPASATILVDPFVVSGTDHDVGAALWCAVLGPGESLTLNVDDVLFNKSDTGASSDVIMSSSFTFPNTTANKNMYLYVLYDHGVGPGSPDKLAGMIINNDFNVSTSGYAETVLLLEDESANPIPSVATHVGTTSPVWFQNDNMNPRARWLDAGFNPDLLVGEVSSMMSYLAPDYAPPGLTGIEIQNGGQLTLQGSGPVPEPGTLLLMGSGLVGLAGFARRRKKKS